MTSSSTRPLYSLIIAVDTSDDSPSQDWRLGEIHVDWVDFTREKSLDHPPPPPPSMSSSTSKRKPKSKPTADSQSLQPLLAHFPGPNPLSTSHASGQTAVGRGVVHLFKHNPPASLIAGLDAHPVGESSGTSKGKGIDDWDGERAEGEDGSLIAILAVPAWMRPADFLEFIGGWATCLEGVRMIREATTPNRSIVLLKFRDPLQASDFLVIFTGRPFSSLDNRETCHPIRIHHLVLHHLSATSTPTNPTPIPAFPPSVYSSRARQLPSLLPGIPPSETYELPSCPVCLERLDSTITGLVTLPCAHTFDCDCLRKWGDSRCPVCRVSHLLLSSAGTGRNGSGNGRLGEATRVTNCASCGNDVNNWICVVCGVVGCGRYDPGKGHARRHWEESGHVLAMELETQRVWDYKGDNYVHRLIQSRNDGKLVELPSASSLVTHHIPRNLSLSTPSRPTPAQTPSSSPNLDSNSTPSTRPNSLAGPSTNDVEKMSTIESITLEYSYLLSSQLESMRQHYESQLLTTQTRLSQLESSLTTVQAQNTEHVKLEKRAEKAVELSRSLQVSLSGERAMTEGLSVRVKKLEEELGREREGRKEKEEEVKGLEETVRDLMVSLDFGGKIMEGGGREEGVGGDLVVVPAKGKKKGGRK